MGKEQRYTFWGNTPVLPMMKENDWDTGNEIHYCVSQCSCLILIPGHKRLMSGPRHGLRSADPSSDASRPNSNFRVSMAFLASVTCCGRTPAEETRTESPNRRRARASAIILRQVLPVQTKNKDGGWFALAS